MGQKKAALGSRCSVFIMLARVATAALCLAVMASCSECAPSGRILAGYFPNWAQHRTPPYAFLPKDLDRIIGRLDHLMYAYAVFDHNNYSVSLTDRNDSSFLEQIVEYKKHYSNLKVLVSVGGPDFPSANFSRMANSDKSRGLFISGLKSFITEYSLDGVDISWHYPGSSPRTVHMESRSCINMSSFYDRGGNSSDDSQNYLKLVREMRKALGKEILITVTGPPTPQHWRKMKLLLMSYSIDYYHLATYDYTISAENDSSITAPNAPLKKPSNITQVQQLSINSTVTAYLMSGVPPHQIIVGIPLFGHTWYVPNLMGTRWQDFGLRATIQGKCCGPMQYTYGAKYGKGSNHCGTYMYSEIMAAGIQYYYDRTTQTAIGYLTEKSDDGWTEAGTWFTFTDKNSVKGITHYVASNSLGGAFIYDLSQDSIELSSRKFTFELSQIAYEGLQGRTNGNSCNPHVGCNVCQVCCRAFLTNQFDCNACVAIKCIENICYPQRSCNVCSTCCSSHGTDHSECNQCVRNACY